MSDPVGTAAATSVAGFPRGTKGVTPPTNTDGTGGFLSDCIVALGFVDRESVERAVAAAREPGRSVERILVENGALTEEELSRAIAERYGFDHVDLDQFEVEMGAARLIGRSTALRYHAVPIAFAADGALIVAVADPVDALAISDIEVMTKSETRKSVASGSGIDALAERLSEIGTRQSAANHPDAAGAASPPAPASSMAGSSTEPVPSPPPESALEAERSRLREQVMEAVQECDHWREAVVQVTQERDRLSAEVQQLSAELAHLRETAERAESLAEGASGRIRELEDADRRAEAARLAVTELRVESEREREQSARLERKLRDELTVAEERNTALARRLSGLMAAAAQAKKMAEELMALHGILTGDGLATERDGLPTATSAERQVPGPDVLDVKRVSKPEL